MSRLSPIVRLAVESYCYTYLGCTRVGPVQVAPAAPRCIIAMKSRKIDARWIYTLRTWSMDVVQPAYARHPGPPCPRGRGEGEGDGVATTVGGTGDASEGRGAMTSDDVREKCIEMINQLLDQGFQRPIFLARSPLMA